MFEKLKLLKIDFSNKILESQIMTVFHKFSGKTGFDGGKLTSNSHSAWSNYPRKFSRG
jgi:hypothetical protein